jgi:hypothetical protein
MTYRYGLILGAALFMSFPLGCHAGPCSQQIAEMQDKFYAEINARPPEGAGRQETAAVKLRDISTKTAEAVGDAMDHAREADLAGDKAACERALATAKKAAEGY